MKLPRFLWNLILPGSALLVAGCADAPRGYWVYVGTRDFGTDKGFSLAKFNPDSGALTQPELVEAAVGPAFFQIHPDGRHLYTINSLGPTKPGEGLLSAYDLDPKTGKLTLLNSQSSGGQNPAYLSFDRTGRFVLIANYNGGSVAVYPILADGKLGARTAFDQHAGKSVSPDRPPQPYSHSIIIDPSNRFALNADLGLDRVYVYKFDAQTGALTANDPAWFADHPASGPRHVIFSPDGKFVYVSHEIANFVGVYAWDGQKGTLTEVQTISTLPPDFKGTNTAAEIEIHPGGKFLYVSNRGEDSIAEFTVDAASGKLAYVGSTPTQGKTPRNFALDPTGGWLLTSNQESGSILLYRVDPGTGKLTPAGPLINLSAAPFCERFAPVVR